MGGKISKNRQNAASSFHADIFIRWRIVRFTGQKVKIDNAEKTHEIKKH